MNMETKTQKLDVKNTKNPPRQNLPKEQRKCRMYFKDGGATFLLCKGLTHGQANSLAMYISRFITKHNCKQEGTFLFAM